MRLRETDGSFWRELLEKGFLGFTLDQLSPGARPDQEPAPLPRKYGVASYYGHGVLHWQPEGPVDDLIILSAGIHGNETGPIEWLDRLCADLLHERLHCRHALLLILGNPRAIQEGTRFVEENLNRLFPLPDPAPTPSLESARADLLMRATRRAASTEVPCLHLDLHTAIRRSLKPTFAICPTLPSACLDSPRLQLLGHCGIQAAIHQTVVSRTFSGWTFQAFGATSFTLELGQVAAFGHNPPELTLKLDQTIRDMLTQSGPSPWQSLSAPRQIPEQFRVASSVTKSSTGFHLCVADDAPNFTPLEPGELVWRDGEESWRIEGDTLYVLFPNNRVKPGERAALLVRQSTSAEPASTAADDETGNQK